MVMRMFTITLVLAFSRPPSSAAASVKTDTLSMFGLSVMLIAPLEWAN